MRAWPIYVPYTAVGLAVLSVWPRDRYAPRQLRWFAGHAILASIAWVVVSLIILIVGVPMWIFEHLRRPFASRRARAR